MKVLVAAVAPGAGPGVAVDGELVHLPVDPHGDFALGDDLAVAGLASGGMTPTFTVRDLEWMTPCDYRSAFADALTRAHSFEPGDPIDEDWLDDFVTDHLRLAAGLEANQVSGIADFGVVDR